MHFIFPKNYDFRPKIFGILDYSTAIIDVILGIIIYFLINIFVKNINIKINIFISLYLPVILFSILGINQESFSSIIRYTFKFIKNQNVYLYNKK